LPASKVLTQIIELPTLEKEEIADMVELQLDEISPFPSDQTYHGFEILSQDETSSSVAVLIMQRDEADELKEQFEEHKILVERLDVDSMVRWDQLKEQYHEEPGSNLILVLEKTNCLLIALQDGSAKVFRSLGVLEGTLEENAEELAREIDYTQTSMEPEWTDESTRLDIWHWGGTPAGVLQLEQATGLTTNLKTLSNLNSIAYGTAGRALEDREGTVDMSPQEWKDEEALRQIKKDFFTKAVAMAAVWLVTLTVIFSAVSMRESKVEGLEEDIAAIKEPARAVMEMQKKIESLSQFSDRTFSALECFRETVQLLPSGVELIKWDYRKSKGVIFRSKGNNNNLLNFNENLQKTKLFSEIINDGIKRNQSGTYELSVEAILPGNDDAEEELP